jgi:MFS family permease
VSAARGLPLPVARGALASGPTTSTLVATVIGNWLEFFDFGVYTFFAVMIGKQFFPVHSATGQLLLSFGAFGVGFVMRPLGGFVLGAYADRAGRKAAMTATILLRALGTGLIAFTPSYAAIGVAAPVAIVLARLLQGFSAGGEVGAATSYLVEVAPPGRRGLFGSFQYATQGLASVTGALLGFALSLALSDDALTRWGWRVPFALGILIAPVGFVIRNKLPETHDVGGARRSSGDVMRSLFVRRHARPITLGFLAIIGATISAYVLGHYMTTYAMTVLKMPTSTAMLASVASGTMVFAGSLVGGWASDKLGRRALMIAPRVALLIAVIPVFIAITHARTPAVLLTGVAGLTFLQAMSGAVLILALPESFPREVRSLGVALVYAAGVTIFGGSAQVVVTWILAVTGDPMSPAWYLVVTNFVSVAALLFLEVRPPHQALD